MLTIETAEIIAAQEKHDAWIAENEIEWKEVG